MLSGNRSFAGDLLQNNLGDGSRSTLTYNFHTRKRGRHKEKEVFINKYIIVTRVSEKKTSPATFTDQILAISVVLIETSCGNRRSNNSNETIESLRLRQKDIWFSLVHTIYQCLTHNKSYEKKQLNRKLNAILRFAFFVPLESHYGRQGWRRAGY